MKLLLLTLVIFYINGCSKPTPCKPVPCVQNYPKLPTYRVPSKKHMTKPVALGKGLYAVVGTELRDCLQTNAKLRRVCSNYCVVNKRINKEYNK